MYMRFDQSKYEVHVTLHIYVYVCFCVCTGVRMCQGPLMLEVGPDQHLHRPMFSGTSLGQPVRDHCPIRQRHGQVAQMRYVSQARATDTV